MDECQCAILPAKPALCNTVESLETPFDRQTYASLSTQRNSSMFARIRQSVAVFTLGVVAVLPLSVGAQAGRPFSVEVSGQRRLGTMILIPGLTNDGRVWESTVGAFGQDYEMHVISLPGFAGGDPIAADSGWIERMRDGVIAYAREKGIEKPILVGHSLGGFLSLWMAATEPALPSAVINIDGLPFLGATVNPNATVESVRPQAEQMRQMMTSPNSQFGQMQEQQIRMMAHDSSVQTELIQMARESDTKTVGTAMYELFTTDLRTELAKITVPVLNLHAWAAYKNYGTTRESVQAMLANQYAKLSTGTTRIHDESYHFIMYDEPDWLFNEMRTFLAVLER